MKVSKENLNKNKKNQKKTNIQKPIQAIKLKPHLHYDQKAESSSLKVEMPVSHQASNENDDFKPEQTNWIIENNSDVKSIKDVTVKQIEEEKDKKVKKSVPEKKEKENEKAKDVKETQSRHKAKHLNKIQKNNLTIVNETGETDNKTIDMNMDELHENNSEKSSSSQPATQKLAIVNFLLMQALRVKHKKELSSFVNTLPTEIGTPMTNQ